MFVSAGCQLSEGSRPPPSVPAWSAPLSAPPPPAAQSQSVSTGWGQSPQPPPASTGSWADRQRSGLGAPSAPGQGYGLRQLPAEPQWGPLPGPQPPPPGRGDGSTGGYRWDLQEHSYYRPQQYQQYQQQQQQQQQQQYYCQQQQQQQQWRPRGPQHSPLSAPPDGVTPWWAPTAPVRPAAPGTGSDRRWSAEYPAWTVPADTHRTRWYSGTDRSPSSAAGLGRSAADNPPLFPAQKGTGHPAESASYEPRTGGEPGHSQPPRPSLSGICASSAAAYSNGSPSKWTGAYYSGIQNGPVLRAGAQGTVTFGDMPSHLAETGYKTSGSLTQHQYAVNSTRSVSYQMSAQSSPGSTKSAPSIRSGGVVYSSLQEAAISSVANLVPLNQPSGPNFDRGLYDIWGRAPSTQSGSGNAAWILPSSTSIASHGQGVPAIANTTSNLFSANINAQAGHTFNGHSQTPPSSSRTAAPGRASASDNRTAPDWPWRGPVGGLPTGGSDGRGEPTPLGPDGAVGSRADLDKSRGRSLSGRLSVPDTTSSIEQRDHGRATTDPTESALRLIEPVGRISPSDKPQLKVEGGELKIGTALKEEPPGCDPPLKTEAGADTGCSEAGADPDRTKLTTEPAAGGPDGDGDGPSVCPPPQKEIVSCDCDVKNEVDVGPVYCRLGSAATLEELRQQLAEQTGFSTEQVRLETVRYTGHEGKTEQGCPIAKWVLRRRDGSEQLLAVAKRRPGHRCRFTFLVLMLVVWDALAPRRADTLYSSLVERLNRSATPTRRGCGANRPRTCMCQGLDSRSEGASFSFGCSYSMYFNACKFARSHQARKFRLNHPDQEAPLEQELQELATEMAPLYRRVAPVAYQNQVRSEQAALECRLGLAPGRPWSGVTACLDFCAHAHRDIHNTRDGCTAVLTLLKPRGSDMEEPPPGQGGPGASVGQPTAVQSDTQLDQTDTADGERISQNTAPAVGERDDGLNGWSSDAQLSSVGQLTPNGLLEPNGQLNFSNGHLNPPDGQLGLPNGLQSPGIQLGPSDGQLNTSGYIVQPAPCPDPSDSQPACPTADPAEEVDSPSESPDEQLHVLPLYVLEESGEEQRDGVQRLHSYPVEIRRREVPLATCTVRRAAKRPLSSRPGPAAAAPGSALRGRVSAAARPVHWPGLQEALGSCGRAVVGWLGGEPGALPEPGAGSGGGSPPGWSPQGSAWEAGGTPQRLLTAAHWTPAAGRGVSPLSGYRTPETYSGELRSPQPQHTAPHWSNGSSPLVPAGWTSAGGVSRSAPIYLETPALPRLSDPVLYPGTPALSRPSDARQPLGPAAGSARTAPADGRDAPGAPAVSPARQRWQSVLPGQAVSGSPGSGTAGGRAEMDGAHRSHSGYPSDGGGYMTGAHSAGYSTPGLSNSYTQNGDGHVSGPHSFDTASIGPLANGVSSHYMHSPVPSDYSPGYSFPGMSASFTQAFNTSSPGFVTNGYGINPFTLAEHNVHLSTPESPTMASNGHTPYSPNTHTFSPGTSHSLPFILNSPVRHSPLPETPSAPLDPTMAPDVPHSGSWTGAGGDRSEAGWDRTEASGGRSGADWERTEDGVRVRRYQSDCSASFSDRRAGGVAVALTHGSLLLECAVDELHATTALRRPDRRRPSRLSLVFYQHKGLQRRRHGWIALEERRRQREERRRQREEGRRAAGADRTAAETGGGTSTTQTWSTAPPAAVPCLVTGPYAPWQMGYVAAMAPHRPNQELFIV